MRLEAVVRAGGRQGDGARQGGTSPVVSSSPESPSNPTSSAPSTPNASKSQSVLDALADAETLRLNVYTADLCLAAGHGGRVAQLLTYFKDGQFAGMLEPGYTVAAARAAFRAVPGLRCCQ